MPRQYKPSRLKNKPREVIKIRLPGFEFTIINPTCMTIVILAIALIFLLAVYMIFFFQLKK